ncbi:membrane hypothetical protein [Candidatus Xenohaliotis californiensis]|uniref:Rod shape-determining protein MreD n=1 Tax=Candidatus Xenohaliotis californiensis TaxID=84677 RepID=A0ABM9N8T7_9RICK|nr:membrane hypothetical protein [Candidatus Xenohaliotis californiensis]
MFRNTILKLMLIFIVICYNFLAKSYWPFIFILLMPILFAYKFIDICYLFFFALINDISLGNPLGLSTLFLSSMIYVCSYNNIKKLFLSCKKYILLNLFYYILWFLCMKLCRYQFYTSYYFIKLFISSIVLLLINSFIQYSKLYKLFVFSNR